MIRFHIFFIFIFLSGYQLHSRPVDASAAGKKVSQTAIKIHMESDHFVDIEVPISQTWIGCSDGDPSSDASYMSFYASNGDQVYEFFYRKHYGGAMCLEAEREYLEMIKGSPTVRMVGAGFAREKLGPQKGEPRIPRRFKNVKKTTSIFFVRLQAGSKCKSYFEHHCELPKNYWADMIPRK